MVAPFRRHGVSLHGEDITEDIVVEGLNGHCQLQARAVNSSKSEGLTHPKFESLMGRWFS